MAEEENGIRPVRVMIRNGRTEEVKEYVLPVDGPQMIADLITLIPDLGLSRVAEASALGFRTAMAGGIAGWWGEYLEIRRLSPADECSESDPEKMCADCKEGWKRAGGMLSLVPDVSYPNVVYGETDDPATHPVTCTCIFCIPGA